MLSWLIAMTTNYFPSPPGQSTSVLAHAHRNPSHLVLETQSESPDTSLNSAYMGTSSANPSDRDSEPKDQPTPVHPGTSAKNKSAVDVASAAGVSAMDDTEAGHESLAGEIFIWSYIVLRDLGEKN